VRRRRALLPCLAVAALLALPQAASAHATLERTAPARGEVVASAPDRVAFWFSEGVEAAFGAVRVYDAGGEEVQKGPILRPDGNRSVGIGLPAGLPDGTYTATYRVISADGHPVSGGFTFNIGHAGAAPSKGVADLLGAGNTGKVTEVAFGAAKALGYLAIALVLGGLGFLAFVWRPALAEAAGGEEEWARAAGAFRSRAVRLLSAGLALGILTSAAGLVLQGATAAGTSAWSAMDPTVIREVAGTHAGTAWALRLGVWALLALAGGVVLDGYGIASTMLMSAALVLVAAAVIATLGRAPRALALNASAERS